MAKNIKLVLNCSSVLESAIILYDSSISFQHLIQLTNNDDEHKIDNNLDLMIDRNYKSHTIDQLRTLWDENAKSLPKLSKVSKSWLKSFLSNFECITKLFIEEKYEKDQASSNIRKLLSNFMSKQWTSTMEIQSELVKFCTTLTDENLADLNDVTADVSGQIAVMEDVKLLQTVRQKAISALALKWIELTAEERTKLETVR